jgi:hypothetical protein
MPTPLMKSLAKQSGKKPKTVENLWKKCEKIVKKEYDIDEKSERFYPLVVGCLKNLLDIKKDEQKDDVPMAPGASPQITTTTYGSNNGQGAIFQPKLFTVSRQSISPMSVEEKKTSKTLKKIKKKIEEDLTIYKTFDELLSENLKYFSKKFEDSDKIVESAIIMVAKYLKLEESNLNDLK